MKNYLKIIQIDEYSITPKYLQICNSILRGIEERKIEKDDILPSINDLSIALEVARNTIERAYKELKKYNVISSVAGKGYFITDTQFTQPLKVLLLFNKLSSHKKIIYDAFAERLGSNAAIDFYIYNSNFNFFKKLLSGNTDHYSKLIIFPFFVEDGGHAASVINELPKDKLILMDHLLDGVDGDFGAVYEKFEEDIYNALSQLLDKLSKYHTLKIIFPENSYYSKDILTGFITFCRQYAFDYEVIHDLQSGDLTPGAAYINLKEDDLVELVELIISSKLKVGEDIGVISYNETPLKKVILNGITTISTDFKLMGEKAAELALNNVKEHVAIPFKVTLRESL
ncbi:GntR family transcriptional regulator [Mucilaginibacter myungsuensis]|uniref:GntR family transcriptional regulator n=1 Tax=Mucilaginibacter myungsuensis TaxID=649104 RepID=A0A929PVY8_9SPHI|nr:GntR family transcriptional regulator [Mucilaginibacter myungsuensis]MBE9661521.1 GntR family transcriptional regulator [Mucilaginibacter myungsuensis]MDN3597664.1 GntR family transcriptional regulator [Mucilaginibacter myungsuensis]